LLLFQKLENPKIFVVSFWFCIVFSELDSHP
jgi:hypothetical protein